MLMHHIETPKKISFPFKNGQSLVNSILGVRVSQKGTRHDDMRCISSDAGMGSDIDAALR